MEQPRQVKYPLGTLSHIDAEAIGQPGRRTFRLVLEAGEARCSVWLEKEQLFQLAVYLQQVMESLPEEERQRESQPREPEWTGGAASIEFKARQFVLSHDSATNCFYLLAYEQDEPEAEDEQTSSVSFWITISQAEALSEEALRVCAAGRPLCFLCGLPINPEGHVCPRSNGHTVFEAG